MNVEQLFFIKRNCFETWKNTFNKFYFYFIRSEVIQLCNNTLQCELESQLLSTFTGNELI